MHGDEAFGTAIRLVGFSLLTLILVVGFEPNVEQMWTRDQTQSLVITVTWRWLNGRK